jgi:exodeoxyribonuclease V alpha subunit
VLPTGADRVNAALHYHVLNQRSLHSSAPNLPDFTPPVHFIPGEPVIMQVNDYKRMVFNGDQGFVLNVSDGLRLRPMVVFPRSDSFVAFDVDSLTPVLLHSYAMTVHKAQGSEFEHVVLMLPDRDLPINTRQILYTALTRSKVGMLIIGRRDILESGIMRVLTRDSGIAEKLEV